MTDGTASGSADRFLCAMCEYDFGPKTGEITPCPRCGATDRVNAKYRMTIRARTGGRRRRLETLVGTEMRGDGKGRIGKERIVDRRKNLYRERVIDLSTGETIRDVTEPLDEHRGRGAAKAREDDEP